MNILLNGMVIKAAEEDQWKIIVVNLNRPPKYTMIKLAIKTNSLPIHNRRVSFNLLNINYNKSRLFMNKKNIISKN